MENHYKILGLNSSATPQEIRRAYRILARRYHPDVNPGKDTENSFKLISRAYDVLGDATKKKQYDIELERELKRNPRVETYRRNQEQRPRTSEFGKSKTNNFGKPAATSDAAEKPKRKTSPQRNPKTADSRPSRHPATRPPQVSGPLEAARKILTSVFNRPNDEAARPSAGPSSVQHDVRKVSIVEVSVSLRDALLGVKKTVEISEPEGPRKVSVSVPPGVRTGSVVRLRSREGSVEDLVIVIRVASHPFMAIQNRGLVVDVPITVSEAVSGASITVPTLEEPVVVRVPAGSSSGHELRLKEKGIAYKDGTRGDLFFRLMIKIPESPDAVGLKDQAKELDQYYEQPVRHRFPRALLDENLQ